MRDDDIMHKIAAWDWLAVVVLIVGLALLALTESGIASW